jgi:hypothetical protein
MINIIRKINGVETVIASVSNKNASHKQVIMGADEVSIGIVVSQVLDVKDGDYIYHNGIVYTCNRDAEYTKFSNVNYQYNLLFEHPFYRLLDKLFTYPLTGSAVFTLTGKLVDFVDAVCWNMNYHATNNPRGIDSGWTRGSVVDTDYLTLTFGSISCRDAITQIATAFNAEFFFSGSGKTINFVDHIENETGLVFVQGRGNGLYSVSQQNVDTKDTITRVYPVGGNQNVPNAYADEDGNLKLPELYLQNTSEYSRIVEKRVVFEDVFPHFVGDVESVAGTNNVEIVCSDIDFDLNEIAVGSNARINFLTGALMGISFQFQFDFATKKVTLIPQNDDTALVNDDGTVPQVPQALKKAVVGDKFNFTGVVMPVQYVNAAITKLRDKGTSWLSFYSRKRVKFGLDIDYRWMRDKQALNPGDLVTIQIPERSVDKTIRISEINTSLYDGQLNATVSNYRDENWQKKVEGAISSLQTTVSGGGSGSGGVDILERYDERPASDRNVMSSLRSEKNFLRKDATDTAAERITFDKGAVVRDLATKDFVQDKFAGAGAGIYEDSQGNTVIEVDKLNVRKEAWFNEIVINQIRFQGGIVVYSAATLEVSGVADGGSYLQVYFDTKDGQLSNQFAVDDQIRCQRFSGGNVIKYYMSRVTSVGADYIRLSKSDIDGTLNVEVGDAIVQFGNRTNTARQSLIEVNVLDGGKQTFYQGVNSYTLTNKNYLELGRILVDGQWKNMIRSFGGAYLGNRDLSSYIQYNEVTGKVEIKASVEFLGVDGSYKTVDQAIGDIKIGGKNYVINGQDERSFGASVISNLAFSAGQQITLSFYGKFSGLATSSLTIIIYNGGSTDYDGTSLVRIDINNSEYTKYERTITLPASLSNLRLVGYIGGLGVGTGYAKLIQCEVGNKATDFKKSETEVQAQINTSLSLLADITNDNKLTPDEKKKLKPIYDSIVSEFNLLYNQADDVGAGAFDPFWDNGRDIQDYLSPILANLETTSTVDGALIRNLLSGYYTQRAGVITAINNAINISAKSLDFVKSAIENGSAEFQGGLGLINLLFMKNLLDQVTGGMSGLDGDNVGFWTGGTYAQALSDASKAFKSAMSAAALDKKDGSGHRAFGKLAWNTDGDVYLKGMIEAIAGKFGLMNISGETIISDHLKFTNEPIESKSIATSAKTYTIPAKYQLSQIFKANPTAIMDSAEITIETATTIPYVRATKENSSSWYLYSDDENDAATLSSNCYCYVKVKLQCINNGIVIVESESANVIVGCVNGNYVFPDNGWGTSLVNIAVSAGTVKFRMIATISNFSPNEYVQWVSPAIRLPFNMLITADNMSTNLHTNISVSAYVKRAFFGSDGFYVFANQNRYVYFRGAGDSNDEFECKLGTKILRISENGGFDIPAGLGGASINSSGGVVSGSPWGKMTIQGNGVSKNGSNYTITHYIGDTNYSLILTPISANVPYFTSKSANTVVVTCAGGFDFVLIRTK